MTSLQFRFWQIGDDKIIAPWLEQMGWMGPDRYAAKFNDVGLQDESIIIAEVDGVPVGHSMVALRTVHHGESLLRIANIGQVIVHSDNRMSGVGSALIDRSIKFSGRLDTSLIWLVAHKEAGPAFGMYERRGFRALERRLSATVDVGSLPIDQDLQVSPVDNGNVCEIARLRKRFSMKVAGVPTEHYDVSDQGSWVCVRRRARIVAAAFVGSIHGVPTIKKLLFDESEYPGPVIGAILRGLDSKANEVRVHGNPASPLVVNAPGFSWQVVPGEHMCHLVSFRAMLEQLKTCLKERAIELRLKSSRLALQVGNEVIGIQLADNIITLSDPLPGDLRIEFKNGIFPGLLLGVKDWEEELSGGSLEFYGGDMLMEDACNWLFQFQHMDATQISGW